MDDDPFDSSSDPTGGSFGMATVVTTATKPKKKKQAKGIPKWNVVLWDSDEHTYDYVMIMLKELFGHADETCFVLTKEVDEKGKAIVLTTTHEHAELKRDQILAYGKDAAMKNCKGSMHCTIEQVE